eukprot:4209881-Pyramimonas_sp.AAC.1
MVPSKRPGPPLVIPGPHSEMRRPAPERRRTTLLWSRAGPARAMSRGQVEERRALAVHGGSSRQREMSPWPAASRCDQSVGPPCGPLEL